MEEKLSQDMSLSDIIGSEKDSKEKLSPSPSISPSSSKSLHFLSPTNSETTIIKSPGKLPRKILQSCHIESHTIQKTSSSTRRALAAFRPLPEAAYFVLFTLVVKYQDSSTSVITEHRVLRNYQQFGSLHVKLKRQFPKSTLPSELPRMRKKRYDNAYIDEKVQELNQYLEKLFNLQEIKSSRLFRGFLDETEISVEGGNSESEEENSPTKNAIEALPGTIVTIRAGQSFSVSLNLEQKDDVATWQYSTKKHDIGFSATFNGETIRVYTREETQKKPIKGSFKCSRPGTCTLTWDNTYTWSKVKTLIYRAEVICSSSSILLETKKNLSSSSIPIGTGGVSSSPMKSEVKRNLMPIPSDTNVLVADCRRSGYIAQTRRRSMMNPRNIVNSSINMITKPFLSPQKRGQELKSGMLIVERSIRMRGRHWYRKWFVLNPKKGVLRYYDSEIAAVKGLSTAKLYLTYKNASLAITRSEEASPTPFLFIIRAGKKCWKICTNTQAEYNEWEDAISTAILTSQTARRRPNASRTMAQNKDLSKDPNQNQSEEDFHGIKVQGESEENEEVEEAAAPCGTGEKADHNFEKDSTINDRLSDEASFSYSDDDEEFEEEEDEVFEGRHYLEGIVGTGSKSRGRESNGGVLVESVALESSQAWISCLYYLNWKRKAAYMIWLNVLLFALYTAPDIVILSIVVVSNTMVLYQLVANFLNRKSSISSTEKNKKEQ